MEISLSPVFLEVGHKFSETSTRIWYDPPPLLTHAFGATRREKERERGRGKGSGRE